jgi:hypothetical protein
MNMKLNNVFSSLAVCGVLVGAVVMPMVGGCAAAPGAAPGSPSGRPSLTSNLQIEAGQTFVYAGEAGAGGYSASVRNVGPVAVTLGRRIGKTDTALRVLNPGEVTLAEFARGQGTLFQNLTKDQAKLLVQIWGDTNVEMKYQTIKGLAK